MSAAALAEQQDTGADIAPGVEKVRDDEDRTDDEEQIDDVAAGELESVGTYSISSYGADYTVDALVKRLQTGAFFIPSFQRAYVWTKTQASQFIESLLLGLPVPGIFVARQGNTAKHLVVDGQQRLKTLQYFFEKDFEGSIFKLKGINERWCGKTIDQLDGDDRQRLDDSIIHTTVFKQDKPEDDTSVYFVFERLNTGGSNLHPQEIRSCVSYGRFIELLRDINQDEKWRKLFGPPSKQQRDQELILRFLAFFYDLENYKRPLREFLNEFARRHRNIDEQTGAQFKKLFLHTVGIACNALGSRAFRPERNLNAAVFDAVMVGLAKRLENWPIIDANGVRAAYDKLLNDSDFQKAYSSKTTDVERVRSRFDLAEKAFQGLE